jgi:1-acyl-sn-glycerol-3-phosphate acyltransferase
MSTFDVVMHQGMLKPFTSFLGKAESTKVPGVGGLCEILDQLLVSREKKSAEASELILNQIKDRQKLAE